MRWLDPAALLALPLLLALLLWLRRRRPRRSPRAVPRLELWREAEAEGGAPRVTRPWWRDPLLALRIAVLAAGVIALARPFTGAPGRLVLVVDVSASMQAVEGGRSRLDRARELALEALRELPRGTLVRVVAAGPAARVARDWSVERGGVARALAELEPTDGVADLATAVGVAMAAAGAGGRVLVISDGDPPPGVLAAAPRTSWRAVGGAAENVGIVRMAARRGRLGAGEYELLVEVLNASSSRRRVPLRVAAEGAPVTTRTLDLQPGASRSVIVGGLAAGASIAAELEVEDDLEADDRAWLCLPPEARRTVALSVPDAPRLARALALYPRVAVEGSVGAGEADLLVVERMEAAARTGAAVLRFVPGGEAPPGPVVVPAPLRGHPAVAWLEAAPLRASRATALAPAPTERVLLEGPAGALLSAFEAPGRRRLTVGLDPRDPVWTASPSFPLFVAAAVDWLTAAGPEVVTPLEPGAAVDLGGAGLAQDEPIVVVDPEGRRHRLNALNGTARFGDSFRAGLYRVEAAAGSGRFAVSLTSAAESRLVPPSGAPSPSGAPAAAREPGPGRELWRPWWLAALALALGELAWIAHRAPTTRPDGLASAGRGAAGT